MVVFVRFPIFVNALADLLGIRVAHFVFEV
jgi:hypothetical protein